MSSARVYNNLPLPLPNILEGVTLIAPQSRRYVYPPPPSAREKASFSAQSVANYKLKQECSCFEDWACHVGTSSFFDAKGLCWLRELSAVSFSIYYAPRYDIPLHCTAVLVHFEHDVDTIISSKLPDEQAMSQCRAWLTTRTHVPYVLYYTSSIIK